MQQRNLTKLIIQKQTIYHLYSTSEYDYSNFLVRLTINSLINYSLTQLMNSVSVFEQINFFQDHTKVILCPYMSAVTYIDQSRESRTFLMSLIGEFGCGRALWSRLRYAHAMIRQMLNTASSCEQK